MNLASIGRVVAHQRRAKGFTLPQLASAASVGRSTLAALESGKLGELGYAKVARICAAVDLVLEARLPHLRSPLMEHRHLTETAGRELTKAAIEEILTRGDIESWRGLARGIRENKSGLLAQRARQVARVLAKTDLKAKAFATLLPELDRSSRRKAHNG